MSKVKGETCGIRKVKLRRSLRRMETIKKKVSRINKSCGSEYRCQRGYYVDGAIWTKLGESLETQQGVMNVFYEEWLKRVSYEPYSECFHLAVVPSRYGPSLIETVPVDRNMMHPIRPKRINTNLKQLRKSAERIVRHTNKKELYNGGLYKKLYDIAWTYV